MSYHVRVPLLLTVLLVGALGLVRQSEPQQASAPVPPVAAQPERVVFLGGSLREDDLLSFTATLSASGHPGVVLLDSPKASPYLKAFLAAFRPEQVIPVGSFPGGIPDLERRLGVKTSPGLEWKRGPPVPLWK